MKLSMHNPLLDAFDRASIAAQQATPSESEIAAMRTTFNDFGGVLRDLILSKDRRTVTMTFRADMSSIIDLINASLNGGASLDSELTAIESAGPVTPMDLLLISHRLAEGGERTDASRLRRLADDMMARGGDA